MTDDLLGHPAEVFLWSVVVPLVIALLVAGVLLARQYNVTRHLHARLAAHRDGLRVLADVHLPAALDLGGANAVTAVPEQVVRGAMGRIRDHHRVELAAPVPWAVRGPAVEAVALVVAELLDNAARGSSPSTKVRVGMFPVDRGVVVQIDDAGVGMAPEQVARAARLLSGQQAVDVRDLGNPAQVGFPVCGVLATQLELVVTVGRQSPYGGTQAIVLLPSSLLIPDTNQFRRWCPPCPLHATPPRPPAQLPCRRAGKPTPLLVGFLFGTGRAARHPAAPGTGPRVTGDALGDAA